MPQGHGRTDVSFVAAGGGGGGHGQVLQHGLSPFFPLKLWAVNMANVECKRLQNWRASG